MSNRQDKTQSNSESEKVTSVDQFIETGLENRANNTITRNVFARNKTITRRDRNLVRQTLLWIQHQNPTTAEIDTKLKTLDLEDSLSFFYNNNNIKSGGISN